MVWKLLIDGTYRYGPFELISEICIPHTVDDNIPDTSNTWYWYWGIDLQASIGIGIGIENPAFPGIGIGIGIDDEYLPGIGIGIGIEYPQFPSIGIGIGIDHFDLQDQYQYHGAKLTQKASWKVYYWTKIAIIWLIFPYLKEWELIFGSCVVKLGESIGIGIEVLVFGPVLVLAALILYPVRDGSRHPAGCLSFIRKRDVE